MPRAAKTVPSSSSVVQVSASVGGRQPKAWPSYVLTVNSPRGSNAPMRLGSVPIQKSSRGSSKGFSKTSANGSFAFAAAARRDRA